MPRAARPHLRTHSRTAAEKQALLQRAAAPVGARMQHREIWRPAALIGTNMATAGRFGRFESVTRVRLHTCWCDLRGLRHR